MRNQPIFRMLNGMGRIREPSISVVTNTEQWRYRISTFLVSLAQQKILLLYPEELKDNSFLTELMESSFAKGLQFFPFFKNTENPSVSIVEQSVHQYISHQCTAILAVGGGSIIDLAKATKARIQHPDKSLYQLAGKGYVQLTLEPLLLVTPTTFAAAENNYTCYISDFTSYRSLQIADRSLLPNYIVYCPEITLTMPHELLIGSFFSCAGIALETLLQKKTTPKALTAIAETSPSFSSLTPVLTQPFTGSNLSLQATEDLYRKVSALQQAAQTISKAGRRQNGGYFTALQHIFHLLYRSSAYQISPALFLAFLSLYRDLPTDSARTNSLLLKQKAVLEKFTAGFERQWQKAPAMNMPALKRADITFIVDSVQKELRQKAHLIHYLGDEELQSILQALL